MQLEFRNFRGFDHATIIPRGHVVLVGPPGGGRSDVIIGLNRVFALDLGRSVPDELDFHRGDHSRRAEVEVTVGELGDELERELFERLEAWDAASGELVEETVDIQSLDDPSVDLVVRLCYRIEWDPDEGQPVHWVDFPKSSVPDDQNYLRVAHAVRERLPFLSVQPTSRPLSLAARSEFRRLVTGADGHDFDTAMQTFGEAVSAASHGLVAGSKQLAGARDAVLAEVVALLPHDDPEQSPTVTLAPDGGSVTGLLRSLAPALDIGSPGPLPLPRHGSTALSVVAVGELLAALARGPAVAAIDDFGDGVDTLAAVELAAKLRRASSQLWLSSRRPEVAQAFNAADIVRLNVGPGRARSIHQWQPATTRKERLARRYESLQLLPALSAMAVAVLEGPHDLATLTAVAFKRSHELGVPLPATHRLHLLDAGLGGGGGDSKVPHLASVARSVGLWAIAVLDHDRDAEQSQKNLETAQANSDFVVRLSEGWAIERLIFDHLAPDAVREAIDAVAGALGITPPDGVQTAQGNELFKALRQFLKSNNGLHAPFIRALPEGVIPPRVAELLDELIAIALAQQPGTSDH